jgi:aspartyl-tRNA(Asn)/glutamyl-tRNA(Gln) amidotransferase subunit A
MSSWLPLDEIASRVNSGTLKAVDLVEKSLALIDSAVEYNAVIGQTTDRARGRALEIDSRVAAGENAGRLAGVPFIAKDNFLTFGGQSTAASNILRGFEAPYQATAIERLEAEGAICVGKANLDAFAHGGSTENSDFGPTKNPHDITRVPGGSSGGSAAAVVLDLAPFALGSDTGGSIRQPASFCGVVGYKPTYGLISRFGVVAMASSTDTIGPLAHTIDDAALVIDIISGKDARDSTTIERDPNYFPVVSAKPARVGIVKEFMSAGVDDNVRSAILAAVDTLKSNGVEVVEVSIPSIEIALAAYYVIVPAEISSNLSRYDGQRYGYSADGTTSLDESYSQSRARGFGVEAKRRVMIGNYMLSSGYYDAYYKKAARVRTMLINEFAAAHAQVDYLLGPVAPSSAFKIGENNADPLKMYLEDIMTVPINLAGLPAVSIPTNVGSGMPVGLQIIGTIGGDKKLLEFAKFCEGVIGSVK